MGEYDTRVEKQKFPPFGKRSKTGTKIKPKRASSGHPEIFSHRWSKLSKRFGFSNVGRRGKTWESTHQRRRKQAAEIPASVLKDWEDLVSDSKSDLAERLFAWSFRVAAVAGLRWSDLLNTAPSTLVLIKAGLIGFASKTKTRGKSEGRPRVACNFAFSNENGPRAAPTFSKKNQEIPHEISGYGSLYFGI